MKEMIEKARYSLTKNILELTIPELLEDDEKIIDLKEFDYCPSDILDMLQELGWEYELLDENGWEQDTEYLLTHDMYKKQLILSYSGLIYYLDISDNPEIIFDASDICYAHQVGAYYLIYDKTQDIRNCDYMLN